MIKSFIIVASVACALQAAEPDVDSAPQQPPDVSVYGIFIDPTLDNQAINLFYNTVDSITEETLHLWNLDANPSGGTTKTGPAAIGNTGDYWNSPPYICNQKSVSLTNLKDATGSSTSVSATIGVYSSTAGFGCDAIPDANDPMFKTYLYPQPGDDNVGGNITVAISNLPGGYYYDVWVYCHGTDFNENSTVDRVVGSTHYGLGATVGNVDHITPPWTAGHQYTNRLNIYVGTGQILYVYISPGYQFDNASLNGLQIKQH